MLVGGDLNIDRHPPNDPCSRAEIKALNPILEDIMVTLNLNQLNHKPTRHQFGQRSSLLDLYLCNIPQRISNIENTINTLSEYDRVKCRLHMKTAIRQSKSFLKRDYRACNFS